MQVKKFFAESIVQALRDVKAELGPDAIILSSKEERQPFGRSPQFIVVAAVSEQQLRQKELTEKALGSFSETFSERSAVQQRQIISGVVEKAFEKQRYRSAGRTQTRYADIVENETSLPQAPNREPVKSAPASTEGESRVQAAVKDAFRSSLTSQFLPFQKKNKRVEEAVEKYSRDEIQRQSPGADVAKRPVPSKAPGGAVRPQTETQLEWPLEAKSMIEKLKRVGVSSEIVHQFLKSAQSDLAGRFNRASLEAWVGRRILDSVRCVIPGHFSGIEYFVGPQGSGKTTSLVKIASEYQLNHRKRVVIVTTDTKKVAAYDQLKVYGRILNVPIIAIDSIDSWTEALPSFEAYDNILVDTPGVSLSDPSEFEFLRRLVNASGRLNCRTHLVLSATSLPADLKTFAKKFEVASYEDVIFNHVDQTSQHGSLLNFHLSNKKPLHSFGVHSDVVEGFEWATRERILDLIFKLTKLNGAKRYEQQL